MKNYQRFTTEKSESFVSERSILLFLISSFSRIYNKRLIIKLDFITSSSSRFNRPIIAHFFLHWLSATVLLSSINWQGDKKQNPFFFFFFFACSEELLHACIVVYKKSLLVHIVTRCSSNESLLKTGNNFSF